MSRFSRFQTLLTASIPALLAVSAFTAASAEEAKYPHAYPRSGVTKLFENERGIAWNVNWNEGVEQPYHLHLYDMAGVYLRWGPLRITQIDGSVSPPRPPFEIPLLYFQRKDILHKEEMIGFPVNSPERWAIMFDVKDVSKPALKPVGDMPTAFPQQWAEAVIDNDRITHWKHFWQPGLVTPMHLHDRDSVQVFFEPGTIRFTAQDGTTETKTFKIGDTRFIPAGTIDSEEAVSGMPGAATIELK